MSDHPPKIMLESKVPYEAPPDDTNVARELLKALRSHDPDRSMLIDSMNNREHTCRELTDKLGRLATGLVKSIGLKPGDRVFIMCDQSDHAIMIAIATILAGAGFMGVYPDTFHDLKHACDPLEANLIATDHRHLSLAEEVRDKIPLMSKSKILFVNDAIGSLENQNDHRGARVPLVDELIRDHEFDQDLIDKIANETIRPHEHVTVWMLTSGSTGKSKIVPWTHAKQMHDIWCVKAANKGSPLGAAHSKQPLLPLTKDSVLSGDLPLDQGAGLVTLMWAIIHGAKFVLLPGYYVDAFWAGVEKYRITSSIASTTFTSKLFAKLKQLIDTNKTHTIDISSFEYICCVGIKLEFVNLLKQVRQHYDHIKACQFYGATEIGFISMVPVEECDDHMDSVGYLMPSLKAKVVDLDSGACCGPDQKGELHLWSDKMFTRYLMLDEDLDAIMGDCLDEDGYYKTGDMAHFDNDGRLYIHGRIRETLTLKYDWKTTPDELEEVVNRHPLVEKSVVVGVPDEDWPGCHKPKAFVKLVARDSREFEMVQEVDKELGSRFLNEDNNFLCRHIAKFVEGEVTEAKQMRGGVRILKEFPTVGMLNKINRKALRAMD